MRKKALLIFSTVFVALLALLSGAGPVSANDEDHYYAYGHWPTDEAPGVSGSNRIYDNDVYTGFVAEFEGEMMCRVESSQLSLLIICGATIQAGKAVSYIGR